MEYKVELTVEPTVDYKGDATVCYNVTLVDESGLIVGKGWSGSFKKAIKFALGDVEYRKKFGE